ncbi:hypothetical protein UPYG_G00185720 [Umbra pygmaea]|uniref:Refilin A n=1 Tax=Umbra pygmaea TaxID=75934 RepID=A0ABD0WSC6_UMBPY
MVGHLHLQAMDDSLKGKNREGLLDSPDSGLPPSPSPPFYPLSPGLLESRSGRCTTPVENHGLYKKENKETKLLPYLLLNATETEQSVRMYPVFFGESIEVNPNPETEIRCNSQVKYDSAKHYRDQVYCAPVPTVTSYSETVITVQNSTWKSYKSQVYLELRQRPLHYQSTTIVYPKNAKNTYRTTLNYNPTGCRRWFVSTVQLETSEDNSSCIIYSRQRTSKP